MGGQVRRAAACQPADDRRQPAVRPGCAGYLRALQRGDRQGALEHNNGVGHNGGIISYTAKGKQYVAVETGWGSLVGDEYGPLFGEPYKSMPKDFSARWCSDLPDETEVAAQQK